MLFYTGGKAHPPRGGRTYWYVLPAPIRAWGLRVAMSIKHAQDNLCIVDSLDIPSSDPQVSVHSKKAKCIYMELRLCGL